MAYLGHNPIAGKCQQYHEWGFFWGGGLYSKIKGMIPVLNFVRTASFINIRKDIHRSNNVFGRDDLGSGLGQTCLKVLHVHYYKFITNILYHKTVI